MSDTPDRFDAVIVGAGFAGMYMLHRLRESGFPARVYEAGDGVGGTWYWNRYPGARCDVESLEYQYSFSDELQREWNWSERYAQQPEILDYAEHVADRFDLRRDIQFQTRVETATYDEDTSRWNVDAASSGGESTRVSAQFLIMATGCLSKPKFPEIAGRESFQGEAYHTGLWPHQGVDFAGQGVGVIGTGSSAIQSIPRFAEQASHVTVFQRTPNFSIPANQQPLAPEAIATYKDEFQALRRKALTHPFGFITDQSTLSVFDLDDDERNRRLNASWQAGGFNFLVDFADWPIDEPANEKLADFVRDKIADTVSDPQVAATLQPRSYPLGTKRICVDTDYFQTYNRDNVRLVDLNQTPIEAITSAGLRTSAEEFAFDSLVYATGFDAMTGAILALDIRGRGGESLREKWAAGPRTYLGLCVAGFPNLFTITGPGSPSVLSNMMVAIEQHVDWIHDCVVSLRAQELGSIEAAPEAEAEWVAHVAAVGDATLFPKANSWYLGANVPGKPRVFLPYIGLGAYKEKCDAVAANEYEGFVLQPRSSVTVGS